MSTAGMDCDDKTISEGRGDKISKDSGDNMITEGGGVNMVIDGVDGGKMVCLAAVAAAAVRSVANMSLGHLLAI
eukprot:11180696-Alexandrium_andersonii.AAC.1